MNKKKANIFQRRKIPFDLKKAGAFNKKISKQSSAYEYE